MLNLSGNSEQAFANLNSINANPMTWIEWNYNSILKPYVVSSSDSDPISTNLNLASSWTPGSGGSVSDQSAGGYVAETYANSGKSILMSAGTGKFQQTFSSNVSVSGAGYYKLIFYVRANQKNATGIPLPISGSSIGLSAATIGGGTTYYYKVVPVGSTNESYTLDAGTNYTASINTTQTSVSVTWPQQTNAVSYNIHSGKTTYAMPYITSIPDDPTYIIGSSLTYTHNLSVPAISWWPLPFVNSKFYIAPLIRLKNGASYIDDTKFFTRVYTDTSIEPEYMNNMVEFDGTKFYKVEVFFGSDSTFTSAEIDLSFIGTSAGTSMFFSRAELFTMDAWNFYNWQYFPIESPFLPNRPGEALLHPYLPDADKTIFNGLTNVPKPVTSIFYSNKISMGKYTPYIQIKNSIFNQFKYYIADSSIKPILRAQYDKYLSINKIVVKTSNAITDSTTFSGSVKLLGPSNSVLQTIQFNAGAFNSNGIMTLYYDGASWSTSRGSWVPPTLTDSGIMQSVTSSVSGIVYVQNKATVLNSTISAKINQNTNTYINKDLYDTHIVEVSPRLEIDMSDLTQSVNVSKSIDDSDSAAGFPIGFMNANSGKIEISNVPVYKNTFPHTIFESLSDSSTFSNLMRQGTKFTVGLVSPTNDFTDYVPFLTMYADSWDINSINSIGVNLFDISKSYLMGREAPEYFAWSESILDATLNILENSSFSDYDFNSLSNIVKRNARHIDSFWSSRKETSFDSLKNLFIANQIGSSIDEYGVMRFYDLDEYIYAYTNNSFAPDFAVTDLPMSLTKSNGNVINYESNMILDSYSPTIDRKIGKVTLNYQVPQISMSDDQKKGWLGGVKTVAPAAAFQETGTVGLINSWAKKSIGINQNYIETDPKLSMGDAGVKNNVGYTSGQAFLQGELVSWRGLEWVFSSACPSAMQPFSKILFSSSEIDDVIRQTQTSNNLKSVQFTFTGKLVGVNRGEKFTSIRNHYLFHDGKTLPNGFYSSTNSNLDYYFSKQSITGKNTKGSVANGSIIFNNNTAIFKVGKLTSEAPLVLIPQSPATPSKGGSRVPTAASNFDYFTVQFTAPNYSKTDFTNGESNTIEIGIYINHSSAPMLIGIRGMVEKKKNKPKIAINQYSTAHFLAYSGTKYNKNYTVPVSPLKEVFDGTPHRLTVYIDWIGQKANIFVDNEFICSKNIFVPVGSNFNKNSALEWGVYAQNLTRISPSGNATSNPINIKIEELYAFDNSNLQINSLSFIKDNKGKYHWQAKEFLNKLVQNNPNAEPKYFYWGPNILTGVYFYDKIDFNTSPVVTGTVSLNYVGYNTGDVAGGAQTLGNALSTDIAYSDTFYNPFKFSKMFVNNSKNYELIYLATSDSKVDNGNISNMALRGNFYKSSDQRVLEKIINPANIQNSITLTSNWLQGKEQAEKLMSKIMYFADTFNQTINVQTFGNPLLQTGDICQFIFSLKKIGYDPETTGVIPKYFIVKSVEQQFTGGLTTNLILKPMFNKNF